jgi:plastocyanin
LPPSPWSGKTELDDCDVVAATVTPQHFQNPRGTHAMFPSHLRSAAFGTSIIATVTLGLALIHVNNQFGAPDAPIKPTQVSIDNFSFSPQSVEVLAGTTVTWINHDDVPHTIKDTAQQFKSNTLDTDDTFSFTFTKPGEYSYFCGIHPHMLGKIVVK